MMLTSRRTVWRGGIFAAITTKIVALDLAKAGQSPDRVSKETLLDALMLDFKRIAATARSIEAKSGETGLAAAYTVPERTEIAITTQADKILGLLEDQKTDTAKEKTAKAAFRARFVEYELAANFGQRLRDDREAIEEANAHNQVEVQDGVENTALIGKVLGEIGAEVDFLDTIMAKKYERQPEKRRAWESTLPGSSPPSRLRYCLICSNALPSPA